MRPNIDEYYMNLLPHVSDRSTCGRRAVGAILTTTGGKILSAGYNGVPSGSPHCTEHPCIGRNDNKGDSSRCLAVHAEQNALLQCMRLDLAGVMYCSIVPCFSCAKMILNTNITKIVVGGKYPGDDNGFQLLVRNVELMWFDADTKSACLFTY